MPKSNASGDLKDYLSLDKMTIRKVDGSLNRKDLDVIGKDYYNSSKRLNKIIKKGDKDRIRKLNEKRKKEIDKATNTTLKNKIKASLKKEKKKLEDDASKARKDLDAKKKGVKDLLSRGVGAMISKKGNIQWRDLLDNRDRKMMLKDLTIMSDANVSAAELRLAIKKNEKRAEVFRKGLDRLRYRKFPPYRLDDKKVNGGQKIDYFFKYDQIEGDFNFYDTLEANVKRAINNTRWKHPNSKFNIRISTVEGDAVVAKEAKSFVDRRAFSLPSFNEYTIDDVLEIFESKFETAFEEYDEDEEYFDFQTILISYLIEPNITHGAGGHKTITQANKVWFISDTQSRTNCFYRSISFVRLMKDLDGKEEKEVERILLNDDGVLASLINDRAKNMKKRLETKTRKTTTEGDIQNWVDKCASNQRTNCIVKIYDNVFGVDKTIIPSIPHKGKNPTIYEVWCINHHFIPLVRWYDLQHIKDICEKRLELEQIKAEKDEDINEIISKKVAREIVDEDAFIDWLRDDKHISIELDTEDTKEKKDLVKFEYLYKYLFCLDHTKVRNQIIPFNSRIATYDIEATANGNGGNFKCYRISLAYNNLEGGRDIVDNKRDGVITRSFGGEDCITKFFDYLYDNRLTFSAFTFYAHNGGKFDLLLLLNEYILYNRSKWTIDDDSLIVLNGAYLNITLDSVGDIEDSDRVEEWHKKIKNRPSIKFRDSMRLLPMSLEKLCIDFNVPHKKQGKELEIDFDEINLDNCYGKASHPPKELFKSLDFLIDLSQRVYCDYDTIGLLECLNKFNKDIYDAMNLDMTGCLTGASLSKQNFFKNYYSKARIPIYHMSENYDAFCREGYTGGRCEAFMIGELNSDCYYYDFTSLYPDVGRRRLPYGRPEYVGEERIRRWNNCYKENRKLPLVVGMMKFKIKTKNFEMLPVHGIKRNHKLLFPQFKEWVYITLWSNEFNYGHELDMYDYELVEAIHFGEQTCIKRSERDTFWDEGMLSPFFTDAVDKKALAKKQKKPALAQSYKIVANSGYGFWGLNANGDDGMGRDGMEIMETDDLSFWEMVKRGEVNNVGSVGDYTLVRTTKPMPCKDFNVAIASAISSEARIKIHKFMMAIRKVGGRLLYCDTDSCICDIRLCDYPDILKEFCWDGTGEELGSMKNEAEEKLEKYFKSKYGKKELDYHMKKQKVFDKGEYKFDKGIIAGCKQYCLYKKTYDGGVIEAEASKGCKRSLDYTDFHHLLYGSKMEEQKVYEDKIRIRKMENDIEWTAPEGFRLYEQQTQFRSGLIEHLKEGSGCDVRIMNIDKSMRINYLKGKVEGIVGSDGVRQSGTVDPLVLWE